LQKKETNNSIWRRIEKSNLGKVFSRKSFLERRTGSNKKNSGVSKITGSGKKKWKVIFMVFGTFLSVGAEWRAVGKGAEGDGGEKERKGEEKGGTAGFKR